MKVAVQAGINFIDTANVYSYGRGQSRHHLFNEIDASLKRLQLSETDIHALDEISQLPPEYPGWMLAFQGQYRSKAPVKE